MATSEAYDDYELNDDDELQVDVEVKPNLSMALLGMILSVAAVLAGGIMISTTSTAAAGAMGQAVMIGGMVGFFVMIAAIAVVTAIYKRPDL